MNTAGVLFVYGVVFLFAAVNIVNIVAHRRRKRRDDLMALADSLRMCGATYRSMAPDHRWHVCERGTEHERGRSTTDRDMGWVPDVTHRCRCTVRWVTPAADAQEIAQLDRMLGAQAHEPDRRTS